MTEPVLTKDIFFNYSVIVFIWNDLEVISFLDSLIVYNSVDF